MSRIVTIIGFLILSIGAILVGFCASLEVSQMPSIIDVINNIADCVGQEPVAAIKYGLGAVVIGFLILVLGGKLD